MNRLKKVKDEALSMLKKVTNEGDTDRIVNVARIIEEIGNIESQLKQLEEKIANIEKKLSHDYDNKHLTSLSAGEHQELQHVNLSKSFQKLTPEIKALLSRFTLEEQELIMPGITEKMEKSESGAVLSPRREGNEARRMLVKSLYSKDIKLIQRHGIIYEDSKGRLCAIAYANEINPFKWFLGVPDGQYQAVILLCRDKTGEILTVILPWSFLGKIWKNLSRSQGQVKFNIRKTGRNTILNIPGMASEGVDNYIRNYDLLK